MDVGTYLHFHYNVRFQPLKIEFYFQSIVDFLKYLKEWKSLNENMEVKSEFMTDNTYEGLLVSLQAVLEIHEMLTSDQEFIYLMTARLNQDCIEVLISFTSQL